MQSNMYWLEAFSCVHTYQPAQASSGTGERSPYEKGLALVKGKRFWCIFMA